MTSAKCLIKSAWIAVEVGRDRCERALVVETYIAVSPLERNFDHACYEKVVEEVQRVLTGNPSIGRASILSMHRNGLPLALPSTGGVSPRLAAMRAMREDLVAGEGLEPPTRGL